MSKPVYNGSSYRMTIPLEFMEAKNWDGETELEWEINDKGNLELKEAEN